MRLILCSLLLTIIVVSVSLLISSVSASLDHVGRFSGPTSTLIDLNQGQIQGFVDTIAKVRRFINIPFAEPPIDILRWQSPVPIHNKINHTINKSIGICTQIAMNSKSVVIGNEDCLYLNITIPILPIHSLLPVIVYIYGGAFISTDIQDQTKLVGTTQSIIYVNIAYRVGVMGFLSHPGLSAERAPRMSSGGYGLEDQQEALRWIQNNIASFGGNPNSITLQGFSAGAQSICCHFVSPHSAGLFHRAISQSGGCDTQYLTLEKQEQVGARTATLMGCNIGTQVQQIDCLRKIDAAVLLTKVMNAGLLGIWTNGFHPPIDGLFLLDYPAHSFLRGEIVNKVPLLAGTTASELLLFILPSLGLGANPTWYTHTLPQIKDIVAGLSANNTRAINFFTQKEVAQLGSADSDHTRLTIDMLSTAIFQCPTRRLIRYLSAVANVIDVYAYNWAYTPPNSPFQGAEHGVQEAFLYDTPSMFTGGFTPADHDLSLAVQQLWLRFAITGNPNIPVPAIDTSIKNKLKIPAWSRYTPASDLYFTIGHTGADTRSAAMFSVVRGTHASQCDVWDTALPGTLRDPIIPRIQQCSGVPNHVVVRHHECASNGFRQIKIGKHHSFTGVNTASHKIQQPQNQQWLNQQELN